MSECAYMENVMARPRTLRLVDGVQLADHLYTDPRKRPGYWRYLRPDGKFKTFQARSVLEANNIAEANNARRDDARSPIQASRESLAYHIPLYVAYRERQDQRLAAKNSWANRKYALQGFAEYFSDLPVNAIQWAHIRQWWETLTFYQQKLRHAEFRRFFNWLMSEGLVGQISYNPFTTNNELPRLYVTGQPDKARVRLTREAFWTIYNASPYPALQIAMGISLTTFMREGDICSLRWDDNLSDGLLKKVIGKSLEQRGSANAARLKWDVGNYGLLKQLLDRARRESFKNYRCPFVISHMPQVKKTGKTKAHACQVTPRRLVSMFAEVRDATGLYKGLEGRTPPTFHEVRSLASKLATDSGYSLGAIKSVMAHESEATTRGYQEEHALPFADAGVVLTKEILGGSF